MIRSYWSDAFQSVYLLEPTTAFLNLLIPLILSQSFHQSNHPSWHPHWFCLNPELPALSSYLFFECCDSDVSIQAILGFVLRDDFYFLSSVKTPDVSLDCSWQSTTPRSHLSHAHIQASRQQNGQHIRRPSTWAVWQRTSPGKCCWLFMKSCSCIHRKGARQ